MPKFRFIPVHTGNTQLRNTQQHELSVHPRAYGEHCCRVRDKRHDIGSSPCIRGTRKTGVKPTSDLRFIPVHTGNTWFVRYGYDSQPVHPRAYGEHSNHNRLNL